MSENIQPFSDEDFGRGSPLIEEPISDELDNLIGVLPTEQQNAFKALILAVEKRTSWTGPLPPPDKLKEYNDALSNGAERILLMTEKQVEHRIELEKKLVMEEQKQTRMGQNFAFIIALAFLVISGLLIWDGHDLAGTVLGTVDLVALVTVFILGRKGQKINPE